MLLLSPCQRRSLEHRVDAQFSSASCLNRSLLHRYRHAWDLHIDREETAPCREVKRSPIIAAKRDVRRGRMSVYDATKFLAAGINDVNTAGAAAVEIAESIDLDPVGHARLGAAEIYEHPAGGLRCHAVRLHIVGAYMATAGVCNVEDAFIV